ncbi:peroxidase 11 [Silene latifolia]|uniref:peroxidase 11 n=1 Tax=Silene latifolia TaxID=37657 RepID=UPI003D76C28F
MLSTHLLKLVLVFTFVFLFVFVNVSGSEPFLHLDYYNKSCPRVLNVVRREMECAVLADPRNAAIILRLHMHDCFVQGCDASVLLDDTLTLKGEKKAAENIQSLRGYKIMDRLKLMVESECPGVVSCADILAIAARDAVILVGGPYWDVPLGRKDARSASYELANANLPGANEGIVSIISKFVSLGLSVTDMVALSGAHTIGMAQCKNFRTRIYGDYGTTSAKSPISESHLSTVRSVCPAIGGDRNISSLDYVTPRLFDNSYYQLLLTGEGLLNSDQEMYSSLLGIETRNLVQEYAEDPLQFFKQFAESMVKMGNITNAGSFSNGEVRMNCRFINSLSHSDD